MPFKLFVTILLPLDVRTLVQTTRHLEVKPFDTGEYVHLGLKSLQNHDVKTDVRFCVGDIKQGKGWR